VKRIIFEALESVSLIERGRVHIDCVDDDLESDGVRHVVQSLKCVDEQCLADTLPLSAVSIDPELLRADDFDGFMQNRQEQFVQLIEKAIGAAVYREVSDDEEDGADDGEESEMTVPAL